jgi:uncharacterized membrane protein YoaK (UPF0700 family)
MAVLLLLAASSGLVDAASYLDLGHTFVANMTGNVVFVGFVLAGATGLSPISSAIAVVSFFTGAVVSGRIARLRPSASRLDLLRATTAVELCLVLLAIGIALAAGLRPGASGRAIVALLALAMGMQGATTNRLRVPGVNSTVVLTTMLATLATTSRAAGGTGADNGRRAAVIATMLAGAFVGALLALHAAQWAPLALAASALAIALLIEALSTARAVPGPAS